MDFFNGFSPSNGYFTVILIFSVIFFNGATDAVNAVATCVGTKCLKISHAVILSAVFNFLGVFIMGIFSSGVAYTVKNLAFFPNDTVCRTALCASMLSVIIWTVFTWVFGIPTSESHALVSSLAGTAMAYAGSYINAEEYSKVLYGLIVSTVMGFCAGILSNHAVRLIFKRKSDNFFRFAQIFGACISSFAHGAQDGLKFLGLFLLFSSDENSIGIWLVLAVSFVMFSGTAVGGKKIIRSVGEDMVILEKCDGFASDIASALCLLSASVWGIPTSTTHTKTSSVLGAGILNGGKINFKTVFGIVTAWILTFPVCTLLGYTIMKILT